MNNITRVVKGIQEKTRKNRIRRRESGRKGQDRRTGLVEGLHIVKTFLWFFPPSSSSNGRDAGGFSQIWKGFVRHSSETERRDIGALNRACLTVDDVDHSSRRSFAQSARTNNAITTGYRDSAVSSRSKKERKKKDRLLEIMSWTSALRKQLLLTVFICENSFHYSVHQGFEH